MKRVKTSIFLVIMMVLAIFVLGVAAESVFLKNHQKKLNIDMGKQSFFNATIKFTVLINDGCGCNPIEGARVYAAGGAGNDEGFTDIDGNCILELKINSEYTVLITHEHYIPVLFDFVIIDDQFFVFQMSLIDDSTNLIMPVTHTTLNSLN
jgi:hypothetical protein